jgi:hypothetical protein
VILAVRNIHKRFGEEMRNTTLLLIFFICLLATARETPPAPHVVPAKVGLVLIGGAQQGLVLAADGASLNADGRVSQEQRLFQAGKQGAIALAGSVSIQDPIGRRVREEVNIARIAGAWLAAYPDVDTQTADREVNAAVAVAVNKFFFTRDPSAQRGVFKFGIVAAGFVSGTPTVISTRYFLPSAKGKALRTERTSAPCKAGDLWIFGSSSVPLELLTGKSNTMAALKADPAVKKFRTSPNASLVEQDYLTLFYHLVRATESDQGKKLDGKRAVVAPPNRFATITMNDGFTARTVPD